MEKNNKIEQFSLISESGKQVDFILENWGLTHDFSYDFLQAHRHHYFEVMIFVNGLAQHDIDFKTFKAGKGNIHFVAPDNVHLLNKEKNSKGYSLMFASSYIDDEIIGSLPFNSNNPTLKLRSEEFKRISELTNQIKQDLESKQQFSAKLIRSNMETILLFLNQVATTNKQEPKDERVPQHISTFKDLLKENYLKHIKVEDYASMLNISGKHLIEICKKHTGKTPSKLIQEQLIIEAKRQLFYTNNSIKETAYNLGFDDPANFSHYFKSATGYSPVVYREKKK
jgi:AraC-like DNA-binding protein